MEEEREIKGNRNVKRKIFFVIGVLIVIGFHFFDMVILKMVTLAIGIFLSNQIISAIAFIILFFQWFIALRWVIKDENKELEKDIVKLPEYRQGVVRKTLSENNLSVFRDSTKILLIGVTITTVFVYLFL